MTSNRERVADALDLIAVDGAQPPFTVEELLWFSERRAHNDPCGVPADVTGWDHYGHDLCTHWLNWYVVFDSAGREVARVPDEEVATGLCDLLNLMPWTSTLSGEPIGHVHHPSGCDECFDMFASGHRCGVRDAT